MRLFLALLLAFFAVLPCAAARAEETAGPEASVTEIAESTITRLELLHSEAAKRMEEGKPREAVDLYIEILLIEPDDDAAYTNMGQAYLMLGDTGRAQEAFLNALNIDPDNEVALAGLKNVADPDGTIATGELHDSLDAAVDVPSASERMS
jgi:tetratricopeptide (TPR) repeat protein